MQNCTLLLPEHIFSTLNQYWPKIKTVRSASYITPYALLFDTFGQPQDLSVAQVLQSVFTNMDQNTLLACPIHVQAEAAGAFIAPSTPQLEQEEREILLQTLNDFYPEMHWQKLTNQHLVVRFDKLPEWQLPQVEQVLGQNLQIYLREHLQFAQYATELQMMLEALPMNQARKQKGLPTVNLLWPWGAGQSTQAFKKQPIDLIVGHVLAHQGLAELNECPYQSVMAFCEQDFLSQPSTVLIDMNDYFVSQFDEVYFEKVLTLLQQALLNKQLKNLHIRSIHQEAMIKRHRWWPFK